MNEKQEKSSKEKIIEIINSTEDEQMLDYFLGFIETIKEKWG